MKWKSVIGIIFVVGIGFSLPFLVKKKHHTLMIFLAEVISALAMK